MTEHVLVVRPDNAGDVLLAGPMLRAVARRARVTLLCGPNGAAAGALLPGVETVLTEELPWIDPTPAPVDVTWFAELVGTIRRSDVERALILTSFHQSPLPTALVLRLAGVPFVAAISEDYPGSLLNVRYRVPDDIHEVERALSLAEACGYTLGPDDDDALRIIDPGPSPLEGWGPYVVVHPGASVTARRWDPGRSAALIDALVRRGHRVAVTGGSSEQALAARVAGGGERSDVVNLAGGTDLGELAAVVAGAEVMVVGNTAPAHLSAAVGTPVVSLYAPTVPAVRWRPWRIPHVLLGMQDIPCSGCRARSCPMADHPCLSSVTVPEAVEAVERSIGARTPSAVAGAAS